MVLEKLYSPEEVAEILQVKLKTVWKWLREGKMRGVRVGSLWRVEESALKEFMKRNP